MSSRRPILACAFAGLVLVGLGLRAWPVEPGRAAAFANRALAGYGLALTVEGPASLRLLPAPQLVFARADLAADGPGGARLAAGGRLAVDLDALSLLFGRAALEAARLEGAHLSPDGAAWAGPLARLAERLRTAAAGHPRRIELSGATLGDGGQVRDLDLDLGWPFWSGTAEALARLTWRGVPARVTLTGLRPAGLASGAGSPLVLEAAWPGGGLRVDGTVRPGEGGPSALAGRARFEAASLPDLLAWLARDVPLSPLAGAFSLEGDFEARGSAAASSAGSSILSSVSWSRARVGLGGDVLEGAGSLALGAGDRLSVRATLAADTLNLAPLAGALARLFEPGPVPLALGPLTRGDLDLRLSAAGGRIGPVQVGDLAASVLVRAGAVEVGVNRARLQGGTVKGRATLVQGADPEETEVRVQATIDRVDLGGLMGDLGAARWVQGPAQGQVSLEGTARDMPGLLARVSGRAALAVEGGAIGGLDLADVIHRNGAIAPGALARRNGRTGFERAWVTLRFAEGVGEVVDAALRGAPVAAALRGQISLPERRLDAQADITARADPSRGIQFEIAGPWDAPTARAIARGEAADSAGRSEAGPPRLPAALGLSGAARADAPQADSR